MTVTMALVDFIPVVLFAVSGVMLMRDLYNKMSKGAFALVSAGVIMIVVAGCFKAAWKLLYAASICDFDPLNRCFFPMQSTGFILLGLGMVAALCFPQGRGRAYGLALVPALYSGTMLFVGVMVLGTLAFCGSLTVIAARMKKKSAVVLFVLAFVLLMGMGYLSSRNVGMDAAKNWIAEGTNILAQLTLLGGLSVLHGAGLAQRTSL